MLKFKYNYQENTLAYQKPLQTEYWYQIPAEQQFTRFQQQGFKLGSKLKEGWIAFTIYENKIRAFYKHWVEPYQIIRYQKDLPKECPVIFTFNESDEVKKIGNRWIKKGVNHE